jgi:hypothetical protein
MVFNGISARLLLLKIIFMIGMIKILKMMKSSVSYSFREKVYKDIDMIAQNSSDINPSDKAIYSQRDNQCNFER